MKILKIDADLCLMLWETINPVKNLTVYMVAHKNYVHEYDNLNTALAKYKASKEIEVSI